MGRITAPDILKVIAKQAKTKALRSKAEKMARQLTAKPKAPKHEGPTQKERRAHRRAKLIELCHLVEKLSPAIDDPEIDAQLSEARDRFQELAREVPEEAESLRERFHNACDSFLTEREVAQQRLAQAARERETLATDEQARKELCRQAEALSEKDPPEAADPLQARWDELGELHGDHEVDWASRFDRAIERHRSRRNAAEKRAEARGDFEALLAQVETLMGEEKPLDVVRRELKPLRRDWRRLVDEFGVDQDLAEKFNAHDKAFRERETAEKEARQKKKEENKQRLEEMVAKLEAVDEADEELAGVEQLLRETRKALKKPGPLPSKRDFSELKDRFRAVDRMLGKRLGQRREADEWGKLFNVPKLEELCRRAEALLEAEDLAAATKELRTIQAEWKKTGPAPRSRSEELWQRFKTTCDQVYTRCEPHFETMKQERSANLEKKVAICEEAESLADSTDWKETAEQLKQLQRDWKAVGPVDRKDSDAIWKRFRGACDTFFGRRKEHFNQLDAERRENLKIKQGLCERAEELADSSDWHETAETLKELQNEWKGIGPVPRKHSDAIWKRFRGACDRFFDRRDAHLDGGRRANLERKLEICDELEGLVGGGEDAPESPGEAILSAWSEWGSIGAIPFDEVERSEQRFLEALRAAMTTHAAELEGSELDVSTLKTRKQKVLSAMEALVTKAEKSSDAESDTGKKDIADQLREAMARNTFRQETVDREKQRREESAASLLRSFRRLPLLPGDEGDELESKFAAAYKKVMGQPIPSRDLEHAPRSKPGRKSSKRGRPRPSEPKKKSTEPAEAQPAQEAKAETDANPEAVAQPVEAWAVAESATTEASEPTTNETAAEPEADGPQPSGPPAAAQPEATEPQEDRAEVQPEATESQEAPPEDQAEAADTKAEAAEAQTASATPSNDEEAPEADAPETDASSEETEPSEETDASSEETDASSEETDTSSEETEPSEDADASSEEADASTEEAEPTERDPS